MVEKKIREAIKRHRLIDKGDKIVVGVSGGPDSVVLLLLLNSFKKELKLNLHIAHLDHMLRAGSVKDSEFVEVLAKKLNLPVTVARVNVKALSKKGSTEEIARNVRLGFLFRVAKEFKAKKIALAHNLDDQAETVLMRILRGTGLYGLAGILPKRKIAGFQIIRPLIEVKRKEIEGFLRKKKIKPCRDPSNFKDIYFRNKIRNRLLPLLEKEYNHNIKEVLANLAQSAGSDYDYLNSIAAYSAKGIKDRVSLRKLSGMHPAIRRMVIRGCFAGLKGDTRRLTFQHIREIEDLILNRPLNSIVDLPLGISVAKTKKYLFFDRKKKQ